MNKKKQSLSAKERKELRAQEQQRKQSPDGKIAADVEASGRRRRVIALVALVVAVIALAVGITVPAYMSCNYMFERNPVAVIKMDANGKELTLRYELFVNDAPIACANFAFLASIGWFNGSVVYDTQNDYVRFGGYMQATDDSGKTIYKHRANDESFTSKLTDNFTAGRYKDGDHSGMFSYRLNADSNNKLTYTDIGFALCAQTSSSAQAATEFQISGSTKTRNDRLTNGKTTKTLSVKPFAKPLSDDAETNEAVDHILGLERGETAINDYFYAPKTAVTVKNVKVYNYSEEWTEVKYEYGFESYMTEVLNGLSTSWSKTHI